MKADWLPHDITAWDPIERNDYAEPRPRYGDRRLATLAARCVIDPGAHLEADMIELAGWLPAADQERLREELVAAWVDVEKWERELSKLPQDTPSVLRRALEAVHEAAKAGVPRAVLTKAVISVAERADL